MEFKDHKHVLKKKETQEEIKKEERERGLFRLSKWRSLYREWYVQNGIMALDLIGRIPHMLGG